MSTVSILKSIPFELERERKREREREKEREKERERNLVNFETEFHTRPRGGLLVTVHLLLTPTLPALV